LTPAGLLPHTLPVSEKEETEFGSSDAQGGQPPPKAFFFVWTMSHLLWAAVSGRLRPAGYLVHRSSNLAICRPPRLEAGAVSQSHKDTFMHDTTASDQKSTPPTHEDFRWIHGPGREEKFANFIELTRDISAGIASCMQIIYARDLVNEMNQDTDIGSDSELEAAPSIGKSDSANLYRLSLAAATLLRDVSEEHIASLNKFWND